MSFDFSYLVCALKKAGANVEWIKECIVNKATTVYQYVHISKNSLMK
jgi:hypothetical protein